MKTFARIRSTVTANIESFVDQLENHEAVATATAEKLERAVVRLRVHRKRAERRAQSARDRGATLEATGRTWRDRTARLGGDRERAIECVRRFRAAKRAATAALIEATEEKRLIEKLADDERILSSQVDALRRRCASLTSREARSDAARDLDIDDGALSVFERWTARIETKEAEIEAEEGTRDSFAQALDEEEDRVALERELDDILRSGVSS
jgi:phage shock protein A